MNLGDLWGPFLGEATPMDFFDHYQFPMPVHAPSQDSQNVLLVLKPHPQRNILTMQRRRWTTLWWKCKRRILVYARVGMEVE